MRTHGVISEVNFQLKGWKVQCLAYEYALWDYDRSKTVYADSMKELRKHIEQFIGDRYREEN